MTAPAEPTREESRWWQRLFGREPKQNAFAELLEVLTSRGAKDITNEVVSDVRRKFHLSEEEERRGLEDLYATVVRRAVSDRILTDQEQEDLEHLREVFRIAPSTARSVYREIAGGIYATELQSSSVDEVVTAEERQRLDGLASQLKLPEAIVDAIRREELGKLIQRVLDRSISDRRLSPEEDEHLRVLAKDLGVSVQHDGPMTSALDRLRLLWRIENGELPALEVQVHLQRGEICHATLESTLYEPRMVTRSIGYSGPQARIRIAKGLYWKVGRVAISADRREEWKPLDSGTLYITNKRLVFDGGTKSTNLLWRRVLDFEVYQDGLKIEKDSGRDQLFKSGSPDMEIIGAIVEAARRRSAG